LGAFSSFRRVPAEPGGVASRALADTEIEGTIVDFSDSGLKLRAFAVVEVVNGRTMVVPVEKLTLITPASRESEP
jgi:hypothetical protein